MRSTNERSLPKTSGKQRQATHVNHGICDGRKRNCGAHEALDPDPDMHIYYRTPASAASPRRGDAQVPRSEKILLPFTDQDERKNPSTMSPKMPTYRKGRCSFFLTGVHLRQELRRQGPPVREDAEQAVACSTDNSQHALTHKGTIVVATSLRWLHCVGVYF